MNAKEMFEEVGMKLFSSTCLLFIFDDGVRKSYAYFDKENKFVETTYYVDEFELKEKFELFKKAIDKYMQELGWIE